MIALLFAITAAWFRADITPEVGTKLAGYGPEDVSVSVNDPLYACGLAIESHGEKVMIVSLDLLGIDGCVVRDLRRRCAKKLGVPEANVMLTCTHNHEGPHTRQLNSEIDRMKLEYRAGDGAATVDDAYLVRLGGILERETGRLSAAEWRPVKFGYYSKQVDENRNRRYTTVDNRASFMAHRRALHPVATGFADKELGVLALLDPADYSPLYLVGNYAAHPLSAHAPGLGGLRISADFPGFFRNYIREETGAEAMYVTGACGDLIGKGDELGLAAARKAGENLAMETIGAFIDIQRGQDRFLFEEPKVGGEIRSFTSVLRKDYQKIYDAETITLELQALAIGDICFVGVPGELVSELGQEIKWHSPFKRTFIAYCATGYYGYISPPNLVAAGGYEPQSQHFACRDTLKLIGTAGDAMFALRERLFPEDNADAEKYPDNLRRPLVDVPAFYKIRKKSKK